MNKFYSVLSILFLALSTASCAGNPVKKNMKFPTKAFVKVEYHAYEKICEPEDPDNMQSDCYKFSDGALGSGSIVGTSLTGSYILTAAHICNKGEDVLKYDLFEEDGAPKVLIKKFYVYDIDEFKYNVEILKYNDKHDICVAHVWGLFGKPIKIASRGPRIGEEAYNMAAPAGFSSRRMVPLFNGMYSGRYQHAAIYTIPAIGGSSGSPILNENSELIGLVYARHIRFHHIILSPRYKVLRKFILSSIKEHTEKVSREQGVPKERSIKIRFGK